MKHTILRKQHNSNMCFVCGLDNDFGLKASFYETSGNELIALFTPSEKHQGYPGRLHGGIASTILDETIGRAICAGKEDQVWGVTVEFQINYRKPIPLDHEIKVISRITKEKGRFFIGTGEILLDDGEIAVSAEGKYLRIPLDKITDTEFVETGWRIVEDTNDPQEIIL
ncbi:MAG: PaaI family thioesterase [Bacteroidetes bacterium]|nr:PaaI family thioesterase [Bacteroidota bacterium]